MEFVFVVPRSELFPSHYPQGLSAFSPEFPQASVEAAIARSGYFLERARAEQDPLHKQVIPYSVVVRDGEVFLLKRLPRGGEKRLHGKLSIGVGGHVNPEDLPSAAPGRPRPSPIEAGTRRELEEELEIRGRWTARPVGILNDDTNAVGAVHVGWVQVISVEGEVAVRETDALEGRFATRSELEALLARGAEFETWSRILLEQIDRFLPATAEITS